MKIPQEGSEILQNKYHVTNSARTSTGCSTHDDTSQHSYKGLLQRITRKYLVRNITLV